MSWWVHLAVCCFYLDLWTLCRMFIYIIQQPCYHATYNEPPSKSVLFDIMLKLVDAMRQKDIPFSFLAGDMPTYKLVTQLKAGNPHQFKDIVPVLCAFHPQMSYIYAIYKRFRGSGMADTLVTAGVEAEGSVDQALKVRHYRRGLRCIMLWREALIHMRLQKILEHQELPENVKSNLHTLRNALDDAHSNLAEDNDMLGLVNEVYKEAGTGMGDFWLSFLEMTDPLVQNVDACHARHLTEYISSTYDMLPGLMAFDNHEYGRWLPDYWAMLSSLSEEQMAFFRGHFTHSITGQPYTCQSLDLWIETAMNLNSKLNQGWRQLLQNEKQLFSTTRNVNNVARVKAALRRNLNCQNLHRKPVECQPGRMKNDEQAVQDLLTCIVEFDADPFDPSNPTLRSLQSGLLATPELVTDFGVALQDGKIEAATILHEWVFTKTATIHRNKGRNFASEQICDPSGASMNVALMERSRMVALVDLAEGAGMIKLESALEGRVTEECLSMFNIDGSMRKTCKSKLLQLFSMEPVTEIPQGYISLVDMGWSGD